MAKLQSQATLFGLDLAPAWAKLQQLLVALPILRSLESWVRPSTVQHLTTDSAPAQPPAAVQLRGRQWLGPCAADPAAPPRSAALVVDADLVLHRRLHLPALSGADLDAAVQLQALTLSPFAAHDLVCAYQHTPEHATQATAHTGRQVDVVLASKKMLEEACQQAVSSYQLKSDPEIWLPTPDGPMLCPGWGESARLRQERRQRWGLVAGALVVVALALVLALTPSLKLRQKVVQALSQTAALAQQTADAAAQRQSLLAQAQQLNTLVPQLQQQIDHLRVLAALTRVLPDDTATQRIVIEGTHLSLHGLSSNATRVQQLLSQEPGFQGVRMPAAITRDGNSNLENFVLEADLDPTVFAIWPLPAAEAPAASAADATAGQPEV